MALKIERVWNSVISSSAAVKRKERDESGSNSGNKNPYSQKQDQEFQEELRKRAKDPQSVQSEIDSLSKEAEFTASGLRAELLTSETGLTVRLSDEKGSIIKVLSSEEFLKLRGSSSDDEVPRGKILDQRF